MFITKADGEQEIFKSEKLRHSLERVGATDAVVDDIVRKIEDKLSPGMSTEEIYRYARELLKEEAEKPIAARYSLRNAILGLGPSGYPFESFLGEVLRVKGYNVEIGRVMQGKCIEHEIDVVGTKQKERILVEAKFHNSHGYKTDVKVALYVHARFEDLGKVHFSGDNQEVFNHKCWLVTNTKFTKNAIAYGECAGITLIGWGYPEKENVQNLIESTGLHPLSGLTTLSKKEKHALLSQGIVLCKAIKEDNKHLQDIGLSKSRIDEVLEETVKLCTPRE